MKKLNISFRKKTSTAKNEPICKLTFSIRSSLMKFINLENKIICEEELIGRNSVTPWTKESIRISNIPMFNKL